MKLLWNIS